MWIQFIRWDSKTGWGTSKSGQNVGFSVAHLETVSEITQALRKWIKENT